jgi:hypothetical protein
MSKYLFSIVSLLIPSHNLIVPYSLTQVIYVILERDCTPFKHSPDINDHPIWLYMGDQLFYT